MARPAFIVEGLMEKLAIEQVCPGYTIRLLNCNGGHVPMKVIARFVDIQIRTFNNRYYPIVVLLDRESRRARSDELVEELHHELEAKGHQRSQFRIGMPDRTIENWILADRNLISRKFDRIVPGNGFEGQHGKSRLKGLLPEEIVYHETTVGVALLAEMNPQAAQAESPSLQRLIEQIDFDCAWISRM